MDRRGAGATSRRPPPQAGKKLLHCAQQVVVDGGQARQWREYFFA